MQLSHKLLSNVFLLLISATTQANSIPELIDLKLTGSPTGAYFEPSTLELHEGDTYLLAIENPYDIPYQLIAKDLAEGVMTQYIQGSPGITQTSVALSPKSKVNWVLRAKKAGDYVFYAESYGLQKTKAKPGVIKIHPLIPATKASNEVNQPLQVAQAIEPEPILKPDPENKEDLQKLKDKLKRFR